MNLNNVLYSRSSVEAIHVLRYKQKVFEHVQPLSQDDRGSVLLLPIIPLLQSYHCHRCRVTFKGIQSCKLFGTVVFPKAIRSSEMWVYHSLLICLHPLLQEETCLCQPLHDFLIHLLPPLCSVNHQAIPRCVSSFFTISRATKERAL